MITVIFKMITEISRRSLIYAISLLICVITFLVSGCGEKAKEKSEDSGMAEGMEQRIVSFNLANYAENGSKKWELKGDSADILSEIIYLTNISVDTHEQPKSKLTSDEGTYDRKSQLVTLYKKVLLKTEDGMELITDSIEWNGAENTISTSDPVKIKRSDVIATGLGAKAMPELKQVMLNKNVEVVLLKDAMGGAPLLEFEKDKEGENFKATITCDGPLEIDYQNNIAVFKNNVKVDDKRGQIYSELMEAYLDPVSKSVIKVEARGNVRVVRGEDSTYSDRAIYTTADQKVVLLGEPKILISADEEISNVESQFKKTEW